MQVIVRCFKALASAPFKAMFTLATGRQENADFTLAGGQVIQKNGQVFLIETPYSVTVSPLPGPGGTPLLRLKMFVYSTSVFGNGSFRATFKMVLNDPMNAHLSDANLTLDVISHQEFANGEQYIVDYDPAA